MAYFFEVLKISDNDINRWKKSSARGGIGEYYYSIIKFFGLGCQI
jgi:hypothetical protein